MIKKLFLVFLFFHSLSWSQRGESIIYLKSGAVINTFVKDFYAETIGGIDKNDIIKMIITDKDFKSPLIYERVNLKRNNKSVLLKVIYDGAKAKLYSSSVFKKDKLGKFIIPNRPKDFGFFAKKQNEQMVVLIGIKGGAKFKTNAALFFSDCPRLAQLIRNGKITLTDKIKAFNYYEKNCN